MNELYGKYARHLIRKLPRYYRYLAELHQMGREYISSNELAQMMDVSPSQIRQDFNTLLYNGRQGVGYCIPALIENISTRLDLNRKKNTIIIGAGNLGQALSNYKEIENCGFRTLAFFDINPKLDGAIINGLHVYMMDNLQSYIENNNIIAALLALPTEATASVAKQLNQYGVKMFLNFNPCFFDFDEIVCIENVHIDDNLMMLSYKGNQLLNNGG